MAFSEEKTVIVICGPTAAGKTALAIRLARHFDTVIISADSRQCYRELRIGVARPSEEELQAVPHYFIASHSIHENITAAGFADYAREISHEIFKKKKLLILAGGTGLYIKAFTEGLDEIPPADPALRKELTKLYHQHGMEWLREKIREKDPEFYAKGEIKNPQRMLRALEVVETTGKSILSFYNFSPKKMPWKIIKIGLYVEKDILHKNINNRVEEMIKGGLISEARELFPLRHLNALRTVGYVELFDYLEGKITLPEAIEQIKIHTRQFAKRQMTWFRKDKEIAWFNPQEYEKILSYISERLS
ncbi:MAG: tRNA (adenosine(37)-N6)-dimethylallyltransferase MiaA [Chitinophagaceae bacterium]|nr:tRNA (adenosine(37)-N6)-dimethylallyltransferase MiaA [Chitinophagaceae bacterium]